MSVLRGDITDFTNKMQMADRQMTALEKKGVSSGTRFATGVASGLQAGGALFTAAGVALLAVAEPLERSQVDLKNAIQNTGRSYETLVPQINAVVRQQETFGHTSQDTQEALSKLTVASGDPTKALKLLGEASEIAAFKHIDLTEAASTLNKMIAGNGRAFKEFGINVKDQAVLLKQSEMATKAHETATLGLEKAQKSLADLEARDHGLKKLTIAQQQQLAAAHAGVQAAQEKVNVTADASVRATDAAKNASKDYARIIDEQVMPKIKGLREAQADTFGGKLDAIRARVTDFAATLGAKVGPAMVALGPLMMVLGSGMQLLIPIWTAHTAAATASAAATDAVAVSEGLALAPILLIAAAIALLVAGVIYAYFHWKVFHDVVNKAVEIVKNLWSNIANGLGPVINWLGRNVLPMIIAAFGLWWSAVSLEWRLLVDVVTWLWGTFGPAIRFVSGLIGNTLVNDFNNLKTTIQFIWDKFTGFIGFISGPVSSALNGLKDVFNTLKGVMDKVHPEQRNSPSLVDNWQSGIDKIKRSAQSLSGLQIAGPSMGGLTGGFGGGGFSSGAAAGVGAVVVNVTVQGSVMSPTGLADAIAPAIRDSLLRVKRSTGSLGLA